MIRWLIKWVFRLSLVLLGLIVVLLLAKNSILRAVAEHRIQEETGMEVRIGGLSSGIISPVVTLENVRVYNTAEFGGTPFLNIPELHVELDRAALAQRKLRFLLVRLNLAELDLVRNDAGKTNIFSIVKAVKERVKKRHQRRDILNKFEFAGIDVLNLTFSTAKYLDLKVPANNVEVGLKMQNEVFSNVKSGADGYGILFMVWLHTGGKLPLSPADFVKDPRGSRKPTPGAASEPQVEKPSVRSGR